MIRFFQKLKSIIVAAGLISLTLSVGTTNSSHHFESPLAQQYPQYDLTDMYVFESEQSGYTTFMMDINPTTKEGEPPAFGENGVYSFHIAKGDQLKEGGYTITAYLDGKDMVIGIADGANQAVGVKGVQVGKVPVGSEQILENGMRVWSGVARDPFVGNSAGIVAFTEKLSRGDLDLSVFKDGIDLFATFYSSIIVIEVPNTMLPDNISVYASSAMYNIDKWEQINRLANPLMTHLFMANNKMEVSEHVGHRPDVDSTRAYAVSAMVLRAVTLDNKLSDPVAYADSVASKLLPDMIPYKVGTKAAYRFEEVNGRRPSDDSMDAALSIFLGRKITDNANTFDRHPSTFPYVVPIEKQ